MYVNVTIDNPKGKRFLTKEGNLCVSCLVNFNFIVASDRERN